MRNTETIRDFRKSLLIHYYSTNWSSVISSSCCITLRALIFHCCVRMHTLLVGIPLLGWHLFPRLQHHSLQSTRVLALLQICQSQRINSCTTDSIVVILGCNDDNIFPLIVQPTPKMLYAFPSFRGYFDSRPYFCLSAIDMLKAPQTRTEDHRRPPRQSAFLI